ncbi:hypothetical protein JTE90_013844 [Oedothorax gibbosus]|uniref:non-specific serine/threonine protein kinase n=1 Tax=Oedothorax gibbosus TaxID=931172 RepID=A0AAV6TGN8_9ARAC|nr:hypothetical protein JTE90_013844 [Oedothorax gibbosus]
MRSGGLSAVVVVSHCSRVQFEGGGRMGGGGEGGELDQGGGGRGGERGRWGEHAEGVREVRGDEARGRDKDLQETRNGRCAKEDAGCEGIGKKKKTGQQGRRRGRRGKKVEGGGGVERQGGGIVERARVYKETEETLPHGSHFTNSCGRATDEEREETGQRRYREKDKKHPGPYTKELIKGLLRTDPANRFTIEEVMSNKWIAQFTEVPQTPLYSVKVLKEEEYAWPDVQEEMTRSLATMRVDYDAVHLKNLDKSNNSLLSKRRQHPK